MPGVGGELGGGVKVGVGVARQVGSSCPAFPTLGLCPGALCLSSLCSPQQYHIRVVILPILQRGHLRLREPRRQIQVIDGSVSWCQTPGPILLLLGSHSPVLKRPPKRGIVAAQAVRL